MQLPDGATYQGPWPPPIPTSLPRISQPRDRFFDPLKGPQNVQDLARRLVRLQQSPGTPTQEGEADRVVQAIRENLAQEFDARQERYNAELKELEAKVQNLKSLAQRRLGARDQIIDRRYDQLLRDAEGLGW